MPVSSSDIKLYKSANVPTDDVSIVGGAVSATQITAATVGEVFRTITANPAGSSSQIRYQKVFVQNNNATSALNNAVLYLGNGLADTPGIGNFTIVSSNSADGSGLQAQVIGIDNTGSANSETITLNGTTAVTGAINWSQVWKVIIVAAGTTTPTATAGTLTISVGGASLGIIPAGFYSATAEIKIGLASTLNDSASSANDLTSPAGISFTKPNSANAGLTMANGGSLTALSAQGMWMQQTIPAGLATSSDIQIVRGYSGTS